MTSFPDLWDIYDLKDDEIKRLHQRLISYSDDNDDDKMKKLLEAVVRELEERGHSAELMNQVEKLEESETTNNINNISDQKNQEDSVKLNSSEKTVETRQILTDNISDPKIVDKKIDASYHENEDEDFPEAGFSVRAEFSLDKTHSNNNKNKNETDDCDENERLLFAEKRKTRQRASSEEIERRKSVWNRVIPSSSFTKYGFGKNGTAIGTGMMIVSCGGGRRAFQNKKTKKVEKLEQATVTSKKMASSNNLITKNTTETKNFVDKFRRKFAATPTVTSTNNSNLLLNNNRNILSAHRRDNAVKKEIKTNRGTVNSATPVPKKATTTSFSVMANNPESNDHNAPASATAMNKTSDNAEEDLNSSSATSTFSAIPANLVRTEDVDRKRTENIDNDDDDDVDQRVALKIATARNDEINLPALAPSSIASNDASKRASSISSTSSSEKIVRCVIENEETQESKEKCEEEIFFQEKVKENPDEEVANDKSYFMNSKNAEDVPVEAQKTGPSASYFTPVVVPTSVDIDVRFNCDNQMSKPVEGCPTTAIHEIESNSENHQHNSQNSISSLRNYFPNPTSLFVSTCTLSIINGGQLFQAIDSVRRNIALHLKDVQERQKPGKDLDGVILYESSCSSSSSSSCSPTTFFRVQRNREEVYELLLDVCETKTEPSVWIEVGETQHCGWNLWWSWSKPSPKEEFWLSHQRVNRLPQSSILASKRLLVRSLNRLSSSGADARHHSESSASSATKHLKVNSFDVILPSSYQLPGEYSALLDFAYSSRELGKELENNNNNNHNNPSLAVGDENNSQNSKKQKQALNLHQRSTPFSISSSSSSDSPSLSQIIHRSSGAGFWICKPVGQSRGRGIFILDDLSKLEYNTQVIVQKYVDRPLVIHGRKVDLRLYVLVTGIHPLEVFISRLGFVRFAMKPYPSKDMEKIRRDRYHVAPPSSVLIQNNNSNNDNNNENNCASFSSPAKNVASIETMKQKSILQKFKKSLMMDDDVNNAKNNAQVPTCSILPDKKPQNREDVGIVTSGVEEGIICDPFAHLTNTAVAQEYLKTNGSSNNNKSDEGTKWTIQQLAYNWKEIYSDQVRRRKNRRQQQDGAHAAEKKNHSTLYDDDDDDDSDYDQCLATKSNSQYKEFSFDQDEINSNWSHIWNQICETVLRILVAGELSMEKINRGSAFELFGFDILLDEWGHPWVLEVNSSPSMDRISHLDERVKPKLIDEILALTQPSSIDWKVLLEVLTENEKQLLAFSRMMSMNNNNSHQQQKLLSWWDKTLARIFPLGVSFPKDKMLELLVKKNVVKDDDDLLFYEKRKLCSHEDNDNEELVPPRFENFYQVAPSKLCDKIIKEKKKLGA